MKKVARTVLFVTILIVLNPSLILAQSDPLPSWNDTAPKKAILAFVDKVTKEGSPDFVPVAERIATFDNDGTRGWNSRCMSKCDSCSIASSS